ncbi:MAG: hypothetical protein JKX80_00835, partial [Candidatus Pacebacteria bacterium]|nr:hypothetical protein [Candidatus Paceibacterota bacterium]
MSQITTRSVINTTLIIAVTFALGVVVGGKGVLAEQLSVYGFSAFAAGTSTSIQPDGVDFGPVWKAWN